MNKFALALASAAFTPAITTLLIFNPTKQELIIIAAATLAAICLAWLFTRRSKDDNPSQSNLIAFSTNPRSQVKKLLAPTHEFLNHLNDSGPQAA